MALIISTIRLRDNQKQTKAYNHHSGLVIIVIIICHHINKCLLSADRFNKNAPIIQMLITGAHRGERSLFTDWTDWERDLSESSALAVWRRDVLSINYLKAFHQTQKDSPSSIPCCVTALHPSLSLGLSKTHIYYITPIILWPFLKLRLPWAIYLSGKRMNDGLTLV